jgi:alcohol dehydrogenase class IV
MSFESGDTDLLAFQDWTFPIAIAYGPGRLSEIGDRCAGLGLRNPLIVTDRGSRTLPFIGEFKQHLRNAGLACAIFRTSPPTRVMTRSGRAAMPSALAGTTPSSLLVAAAPWTAARRSA